MWIQSLKMSFSYIQNIVYLSLFAHALLFTYCAIVDQSGLDFIKASTVLLYITWIIVAVSEGESHLGRLLLELPISKRDYFFASWAVYLLLPLIHVPLWLVYGLFFDGSVESLLTGAVSAFLCMFIMLAIIGIAFDLGGHKPAHFQWAYIGAIGLFIAIGMSVEGVQEIISQARSSSDYIELFPLILWPGESNPVPILAGLALGLLLLDYYVITRADSFLDY